MAKPDNVGSSDNGAIIGVLAVVVVILVAVIFCLANGIINVRL